MPGVGKEPDLRRELKDHGDQFGDRYMRLKGLSAYSGLSVRTLRTLLTHPVTPLPHYRLGGSILIRKSEFDAWAVQFRVAPGNTLDTLVNDLAADLL